MIRRMALAGLALLLLSGLLALGQQVKVRKVPVQHVEPTNGEKMYAVYCAVCHGADGRGAGPAAPAMKTQPTNLTMLATSNHGQFPTLRVSNTILGDGMPEAHGTKDMPVWGKLFFESCPGSEARAQFDVRLRVRALTDYVESLQRK
ncbi:MAG TPA: cytochrome c [Terriglobales bacterium]|nr:cytochrome c [Terriglobales bacterium]